MSKENSIHSSVGGDSKPFTHVNQGSDLKSRSRKTHQKKAPAFDVLVVGELNIDLILDELQQLPETGKEVFAEKMTYTLGSSSAIFAANLSAMGMTVAFVGKIGADEFGEKIKRDLQSRKVDTSMVQTSCEVSTGITVALNNKEQRAMVTYPGAMSLLNGTEITDEMLQKARHLHVSSIFLQSRLLPGIVSLCTRARRLGLSTSLDPQWDPLEKWQIDLKALLPQLNVFLPNTAELLALTGTQNHAAGLEKLKEHLQVMIVKDGRNGAYGWYDGKWIHQPAFLNSQVVDAIGAGDSFNAGFISAFLSNYTLDECLKQGALMGAINTTSAGGTGAFDDFVPNEKIELQKYNLLANEITT